MNWKEKAALFASGALLVLMTGCSAEGGSLEGRGNDNGEDPNGTSPNGGTDPGSTAPADPAAQAEQRQAACMANMKLYKGFGDAELTTDRIKGEAGADRARVKPYSALVGEFKRVTGNTPASLTASEAAFAAAPPRWFYEPASNAISLYTTYRASFEAALTVANGNPKFATAPTDATAATECAAFERKAWSRTPVPAEIDACVAAAMKDAATETDAKRRWAYAFAAVLGAAGFTTY